MPINILHHGNIKMICRIPVSSECVARVLMTLIIGNSNGRVLYTMVFVRPNVEYHSGKTCFKTKEFHKFSSAPQNQETTSIMTKLNSATTSPARQITSVTFQPTVEIHKALHINNMSDEEILSAWYSHDELQRIHSECVVTVDLMIMQQKPVDTNKFSSRGLEHNMPKRMRQRQQTRYAAIDAVLDQQDRIRDIVNTCDEISIVHKCQESIASVYKKHSVPCAEAAHRRGILDEQISPRSPFSIQQEDAAYMFSPSQSRTSIGSRYLLELIVPSPSLVGGVRSAAASA